MAKKTIQMLTASERKLQLLAAGAKLAHKYGASNVTRRMVAAEAGVSEALVSRYMGTTEEAQKAYAKHAKKLKLDLPTKAEAELRGRKLRAHKPGDKRDTRKRSAKEAKAIREKKPSAPAAKRSTKPAPTKRSTKPNPAAIEAPAAPARERKTAARLPKAPPVLPLASLPLPA